jgi:hypothetical protein
MAGIPIGGRVEQLVDARGTVEHGVLGVDVQVREAALGGGRGGHRI